MLKQNSEKIKRNAQQAFLAITGLVYGYINWTILGINPYVLFTAEPMSKHEFLIRWLCLPLCFITGLVCNLLLYKLFLKTNSWKKILFLSMVSFNLSYLLATLGYILVDPITFDFYARHIEKWWISFFVVWISNFIAFIPTFVIWIISFLTTKFINLKTLQ